MTDSCFKTPSPQQPTEQELMDDNGNDDMCLKALIDVEISLPTFSKSGYNGDIDTSDDSVFGKTTDELMKHLEF